MATKFCSQLYIKNYLGRNILTFSALSSSLSFVTPLICMPEFFGNDDFWWCVPLIALVLAAFHLCWGSKFPDSPKHLYITESNSKKSMQAIVYYQGTAVNFSSFFLKHQKSSSLFEIIDEITTEYENEKKLTENFVNIKFKNVWQDPSLRLIII